jgi:hypothetical protein
MTPMGMATAISALSVRAVVFKSLLGPEVGRSMNTAPLFAVVTPMLAAVSGDSLVHQLVVVLIVGICALIIWWAGRYFIGALAAPAIVLTAWNGLFILLGVLFIINFLLGLVGHPFVQF